jgi:hypothetical protein
MSLPPDQLQARLEAALGDAASKVEFARDELTVTVAPGHLVEAMTRLRESIRIVSPERVQAELVKLLATDDPVPGIRILVDTGLMAEFLPEVPALRLEVDEVGSIVDGSVVRAHQDASGGKGGSKAMPSAVLAAVFRPNSTLLSIPKVARSTSRSRRGSGTR